jgi:NAD(P)-dependent dehydrogenase (short-subunit alcohol dehydrogenase family)
MRLHDGSQPTRVDEAHVREVNHEAVAGVRDDRQRLTEVGDALDVQFSFGSDEGRLAHWSGLSAAGQTHYYPASGGAASSDCSLTSPATVRRRQAIADLRGAGCRTLALDVTDEASMLAGVEHVVADARGRRAWSTTRGYSQSGALETVTPKDLRRQFETNGFGLVRMAQLVLPSITNLGNAIEAVCGPQARRDRLGELLTIEGEAVLAAAALQAATADEAQSPR